MNFYEKFKAMTKNETHMGKFLQNYLAFKRKPIVVVIAIVFYTILFNMPLHDILKIIILIISSPVVVISLLWITLSDGSFFRFIFGSELNSEELKCLEEILSNKEFKFDGEYYSSEVFKKELNQLSPNLSFKNIHKVIKKMKDDKFKRRIYEFRNS